MAHVDLRVDGIRNSVAVDDRTTLADCLRDHLGCTAVYLGCEQGVCGACTVLLDEVPVRSCLMLAAQATDHNVTTLAGLGRLDPAGTAALQSAFESEHAVQCGFCTPGMILVARTTLRENPSAGESAIRDAIHGNLCRCTGYQQIIEAVQAAGRLMSHSDDAPAADHPVADGGATDDDGGATDDDDVTEGSAAQ